MKILLKLLWPSSNQMKQEQFILFGNGSFFSTAVFSELIKRGVRPVTLVLPEYPPAVIDTRTQIKVETRAIRNEFADMVGRLSIPIIYAPRTTQPGLPDKLSIFEADYLLVVCWPYLLSPQVLSVVNKAALNLHPSLLPEYRGLDPVSEQLACNETKLGVSLHRLNQQFDSGEIVRQAGFDLDRTLCGREQIESQAARTGTGLFIDVLEYGIDPAGKPASEVDKLE
jgi:methionyl-tRNA formyltransferase